MDKDKLTYHMSRVIDTLFLYNQLGTSFGVLLGVTVWGFQDLIASFFSLFALIKWYGFISLGVLIFNIKPMVTKKYLDPSIERKLTSIRLMIKEGKFTESEERAIWRKAVNAIVEDYNQIVDSDDNLHNPTPD